MSTTPRHLITTADERTWVLDRPVVFLGEWCKAFSRKHIWARMEAVTAEPYGLGAASKDADYATGRSLERELLAALREILNDLHDVHLSSRSWQIILGHWLRRYIDVVINRFGTLEACRQNYQLSGRTRYAGPRLSLATGNSYEAIWAFNDPRWNGVLYDRIMELAGGYPHATDIETNEEASSSLELPGLASGRVRTALRRQYRRLRKLVQCAVAATSKTTDAVIANSFLPHALEVKLRLALGQQPVPLDSLPAPGATRDDLLRQRLADRISLSESGSLSGIVRRLLFEAMPTCYLEGFGALKECALKLPWPERPTFIFTSNNFDTDEVFKVWTAYKVEAGVKYFVGQHGSNYGTYRYMHPSIEEETSDRFLTWGWTDGLPQHLPAFIFKTAGKESAIKHDNSGGILLIELHAAQMLTTWDATAEHNEYFNDQQRFVSGLGSAAKESLTVRLHHGHVSLMWEDTERWTEFDPSIRLDQGFLSFEKLIAKSRLIVYSYDSSGLLEMLSLNIPVIAFWQHDLDHLRDSAKPHYQKLVAANIVHLSPESAAAHINAVWPDIADWWNQHDVQAARLAFCERYARSSSDPIRDLKMLLQTGVSMKDQQ